MAAARSSSVARACTSGAYQESSKCVVLVGCCSCEHRTCGAAPEVQNTPFV